MNNEEKILKIKELIKTQIRPMLIMDGGNIEFVSFNDNILKVKLLGACNGCPFSGFTLKNTVANIINEELKENIIVEAADFEADEMDF